jgi:hypothetical protein
MANNENRSAAGFARSSTSARDKARLRVRTVTTLGAAGAIAGSAILAVGLVPAGASTAAVASTTSSTGTATAPGTLTDTKAGTTNQAPTTTNNGNGGVARSGGS